MKKNTKQNLIFSVLVLAAAGLLLLLRPWNQGAKAVVSLADGSQQTISLSADGRYDLAGNGGITAHLVVEDNSIRFVESECPDHRCEGFGRLSREGDWAACLPAGISVVIEGGESPFFMPGKSPRAAGCPHGAAFPRQILWPARRL